MTVLRSASDLSQAFLTELKSGKMLEAFSNAGARFRLTSMAYDDMVESTTPTRKIEPKRTYISWKVQRKPSAARK
eukprot:4868683-Prorocentrum_lima.AAC.1